MKKTVYYSLTKRGLYSELMNMILAIIYCEKKDISLIVNTRNWNSKYINGWNDYFLDTITSTNDFLSSQYYVDGFNHTVGIRSLMKKPLIELSHLNQCCMNYYFKCKSNALLSHEIFSDMRSNDFIESVGNEDAWQKILNATLLNVYQYNDVLKESIDTNKKYIGISDKEYIGIHIRRGDKIRTKEMDDIDLDNYVDAIKKKSHISKNIYIATDDIRVIDKIKSDLGSSYSIFYNKLVSSSGFDENKNNRQSGADRYNEANLAILDVDKLINSVYFIGTYSSNLSRIIPCFKGFDTCESLDIKWSPVF